MGAGRGESSPFATDAWQTYRDLVETAHEGIGFVDTEDGVIKYCNGAYASILGLSQLDLVGRSFFDFLEEDQENLALRERASRLRGVDSAYEITIIAADGARKHLSATGSPIFSCDGSCEGAVHTILDISERKRAQEALRESEERFRTTFESAAVGMAHLAPDGRWLRVNGKLCEISGYRREELLEMTFRDLTPAKDLSASLERMQKLLEGKLAPYSVERRFVRKNGSRVWIHLSVSLVRSSCSVPHYLICVAEDVTSRKLAEFVPDPLTEREMRILELVAQWQTDKAIAKKLNYSEGTVKAHVRRILSKLEVKSRRQAVTKAFEIGLIAGALQPR